MLRGCARCGQSITAGQGRWQGGPGLPRVQAGREVKVAQSCPALCDPMDYRVHGTLQARILEWVGFPFSRGSSQPRHRTQVSLLHYRQILYQLSHKGSPRKLEWVAYPFSSGSSSSSCKLNRSIIKSFPKMVSKMDFKSKQVSWYQINLRMAI